MSREIVGEGCQPGLTTWCQMQSGVYFLCNPRDSEVHSLHCAAVKCIMAKHFLLMRFWARIPVNWFFRLLFSTFFESVPSFCKVFEVRWHDVALLVGGGGLSETIWSNACTFTQSCCFLSFTLNGILFVYSFKLLNGRNDLLTLQNNRCNEQFSAAAWHRRRILSFQSMRCIHKHVLFHPGKNVDKHTQLFEHYVAIDSSSEASELASVFGDNWELRRKTLLLVGILIIWSIWGKLLWNDCLVLIWHVASCLCRKLEKREGFLYSTARVWH